MFGALADPTRRRLLDALLDGERPVGDLAAGLGISQPTVSKHLRVLRDTGLVSVRVDAQQRRYSIERDRLQEIDAWIQGYRRLWAHRLDALEAHLDREEGR